MGKDVTCDEGLHRVGVPNVNYIEWMMGYPTNWTKVPIVNDIIEEPTCNAMSNRTEWPERPARPDRPYKLNAMHMFMRENKGKDVRQIAVMWKSLSDENIKEFKDIAMRQKKCTILSNANQVRRTCSNTHKVDIETSIRIVQINDQNCIQINDQNFPYFKEIVSPSDKKSRSFANFDIDMSLKTALSDIFKTDGKLGVPTTTQCEVIPIALKGGNMKVKAPTGTGKTISFLVPIIDKLCKPSRQKGIQALILNPSRILVRQTNDFANALLKEANIDLTSRCLIGSEKNDESSPKSDLIALQSGKFDILSATPKK